MADAFGEMLRAGTDAEIVERDDGFIQGATLSYFAPVRRWAAVERRALRFVRGRVLDVGRRRRTRGPRASGARA